MGDVLRNHVLLLLLLLAPVGVGQITSIPTAGSGSRVLSVQTSSTDVLCSQSTVTPPSGTCTGHVATSSTAFATGYTFPANYFGSGKTVRITASFQYTANTTASEFITIKLGGTTVYFNKAGDILSFDTDNGISLGVIVTATAASGASVPVVTQPALLGGVNPLNSRNGQIQPVNLATNGTLALTVEALLPGATATNYLMLQRLLIEELN